MAVDGDDLVALAHPADDVAQLIELNLIIAQRLQLLGDALDDALLLAGLGRNGDHVAQELDHGGLVRLSSVSDGSEIHNVPPQKLFIHV